jgi:von Willebrand factor type D domain
MRLKVIQKLRFGLAAIFAFLLVAGGGWARKALAVMLCGMLSFNSTACYGFLGQGTIVNAAETAGDCGQNPPSKNISSLPKNVIFSVPLDPKNATSGYGKGKDYTSKGEPNNETLQTLRDDRDKYKQEGSSEFEKYDKMISRIKDYITYPDNELVDFLTKGISPQQDFENAMISLFLEWDRNIDAAISIAPNDMKLLGSTLTNVKGRVLRHGLDSPLSLELRKDSDFQKQTENLVKVVKPQLEQQIKQGKTKISDLDLKELCVGKTQFEAVHFYGSLAKSASLIFLIGGTQGRAVFIEDLVVDSSKYEATLRIATYDTFGVSGDDISQWYASPTSPISSSEGLIAQWILQHERTAKPFVQEIIVDIPISGELKQDDKCKSEENKNRDECKLKKGGSTNDPHLVTFDGFGYDLQTVGEFILARSNDGAFTLQTRQTPYNNSNSLSVNSAAAMKIGRDRVAFYAQYFPDTDTSTPLRINGKPTKIQGDKLTLDDGEILKQGGSYVVSLSTGEKVIINPVGSGSNAFLNVSPFVYNRAGKYSGLLGNVNGKPNDDFQIRGGSNILEARSTYGDVKQVVNLVGLRLPGVLDRAEQVYFDQLYKNFANSWRVKPEESMFDYPPGKTTQSYVNPGFPDKYLTLNMLSADQIQNARNACNAAKVTDDLMEGCIFDVGFSGQSDFARATAEINSYIGIVNQLFPSLNIPTPERVFGGFLNKIIPPNIIPTNICIPIPFIKRCP